MDLKLFDEIISECVAKRIGYRRLSLFLGGEPLLHPQLAVCLQIMKKHQIHQLGYENIQIFTNGVTAPHFYTDIATSGVISLLRFSVDGVGTAESFEYMRPPGKWQRVLQNIKQAVEVRNHHRSQTSIRVTSVIPHQDIVPFHIPTYEKAVEQMRQVLLPLGVDGIGFRKVGTLVGRPDIEIPTEHYHNKRVCLLVKDRKLAVCYDGSVSTCSNDLNGHQVLGHIKEGGLEAVWQGPTFHDFLRAKISGVKHPLGFCVGCDRNQV